MSRFIYQGDHLNEISFPLGGIGTGSIGLSGTGRLIDWEIFNRPNKRSLNGFTHFTVKVEEEGRVVDTRVLNSDLPPPYMGEQISPDYGGYGFGPTRNLLATVPHFRSATFTGEYPLARIDFSDETFPGAVALKAFNPLIPLQEDDSSLPVALFEPIVTNTADVTRDFVFAFSVGNPTKGGKRINQHLQSGDVHVMRLQNTLADEDDPNYGELVFSVKSDRVAWQENWYRGSWFDNLGIYWQDFTTPGDLKNRTYKVEQLANEEESIATLTARLTLQPGETGSVRFALSWNFPNMHNYWSPEKIKKDDGTEEKLPVRTWKNYYAMMFRDALASNLHVQKEWDRLEAQTNQFKTILYRSSLPEVALEALASNISLLRSPTTLRLQDGAFYGFEGCHGNAGCCEGSCTHVWNYAYALPYLFPKLERSMRDMDYHYNLMPNGEMPFRLQLPLDRKAWSFRACVDGQMGGVIKTYREWQISGDTEWLRSIWPGVKKSIEYAWEPTNKDLWDPEKKGYMSGRQHHTLDMELFGPNSWLTGMYLGALQAGSRMAEATGDLEAAREFNEIFLRGKTWVDENLFNGEYFYQKVNLDDPKVLAPYTSAAMWGQSVQQAYWNDEAGELKYQIGDGSAVDQILAQWHCDLNGLGDIFDPDKVLSALRSIYKYNYHDNFRNFFNPCRVYCLNDEAGTTICAWPEGSRKPVVPAPYSEETMHGFEYQAGIHMILRGMETEGLTVVKAVRDRYDGHKRNPWNEFECGSNYARSMATYALLPAYSGFISEMPRGHLTFKPLKKDLPQRFFWSVDAAWGEIEIDEKGTAFRVMAGCLPLRSLGLPDAEAYKKTACLEWPDEPDEMEACEMVQVTQAGDELHFGRSLDMAAGTVLYLSRA